LWPEEDPGSDRITNQLMFVPPSPSAGQSSGQKLKKILFYYGLGSWFPLTPGRDMFRDARCPVDTCNITLDQTQTRDADAIVFHDRFPQPGHPRPARQVKAFTFCTPSTPLKVLTEWRVFLRLPEIRYSNFVRRLRPSVIYRRSSTKMMRLHLQNAMTSPFHVLTVSPLT
jgi:hypothetical protein